MRPALLYNLFSDLRNIKGVGPNRYQAYKRLGCLIVRDLIFHYPNNLIDRRFSPPLNQAKDEQMVTVVVTIDNYTSPNSRKSPYKIITHNETGSLSILYFNSNLNYIQRNFPLGSNIVVSGKLTRQLGELQMVHPDIVAPINQLDQIKKLYPVYPLTYGLNNKYLADTIHRVIQFLPNLPEWLPSDILLQMQFPSWNQALHQVHNPNSFVELSGSKARDRLAFDELLAQQLSLKIARNNAVKKPKIPLSFKGVLVEKLKQKLPFKFTVDQEDALAEISKEQLSPHRMVRLLQGDVGSGKTLVALAAMLNCMESGKQAALMVPTEILARQHHKTLEVLCNQLGVKSSLLISKMSQKVRKGVIQNIANGSVQIIIGTHALIQEQVDFMDLGLVVIDEQHRFGVEQRQALLNKSMESDLLLMSATPIPRTLSMVSYGDMDITSIKHKPSIRKPISTKVIPNSRIDEVIGHLRQAIDNGAKAYWLCPLIEESEKSDLVNTRVRYEVLEKIMPGKVGCIHGQMKPEEKNNVMERFISGEIKIVVATTVIEVGVDVPDATIMIIENAENFGLSQLHQLRGRVGRGDLPSSCILIYKQPIGKISYERLKVMRNCDDGFEIAIKDLEMRGGGEVLGTKQSGVPNFKNFDFWTQQKLISIAYDAANKIIKEDPELKTGSNVHLQTLLSLYDHDKILQYLHS